MIQLICFFAPSFLAAEVFEMKRKQSLTVKEFVITYVVFVGIINFLCLSVVAIVFRHPNYIVNQDLFNIGFTFKYLLLSFTLAVVLPLSYEKLETVIKKYWRILKDRRNNRK